MNRKIILFITSFIFLLVGCNLPSSTHNPQLISISFSEKNLNLEIGETKQLSLDTETIGFDVNNLSWSSSDESIATIDSSGFVHAISNGNVTILATSTNGLSAMCNVTVANPSAYESLSDNEKYFFDAFIEGIRYFKDPANIRIYGFRDCPKVGKNEVIITVSGNNSFGGTVNNDFQLTLQENTYDTGGILGTIHHYKGDFIESRVGGGSIDYCEKEDVSVRKINLAIREYFEDLGY